MSIPAPDPLPRLRDEVALHPAGRRLDGSPSWVLMDPARQKFFRIGWAEFEILSRWHLAEPDMVAAAVSRETTLVVEPDDVEQVRKFLDQKHLFQRVGSTDIDGLVDSAAARRKRTILGVLGTMAFIRFPLVNPEAWLARAVPIMQPFFSGWFWAMVATLAMVGALLIGRQWDSFISTFPEVVTGSGIVMMAAILVVSKVFHELGHAITAAHYGCRVSTIGIAFFFGWPVLYTDVTDAWKLSRRGPLLAIAGAGMLTEIAIGSLALFAWSFLPDGGLQTVVFVMATTSWILTLVVNLNPLMRFDGYFLLADLVGVDNLQDRTFRFARWNVRRLLFGTRDEPTERWRGLAAVGAVSYAVSVWVFRAILFGGLSLVVYTFAFKALGIVLFALCLYMFIGRPIIGACLEAWERREDMNRLHTVISVSILGGLIGLAFVPMAPDIDLPAVAKPAIQQTVFAPASGRIASVEIQEGEQIEAGDPMLTFIAPDAEFDRDQATQALKALNLQRDNEQLDDERRGRSAILDEQIALSRERIRIADRQLQALTITAPISGRAEAVVSGLAAGVWIAKDQPITTLADSTSGYKITAYLDERDRAHLAQGATGHFIPDDLSAARYLVRLIDIETGAVQSLSEASLASTFGGPIAVWRAEDGSLKPDIGQFRTIWRPEGGDETLLSEVPMMTGTIRIAGSRETFADRFLRRVRAVTRREFGL